MNEENLRPFDQRSEEEARSLGRKGGIASGEARRRKRTLRELCEMIGQQKSQSALVADLPEDERTKDAAVAAAQYLAAEAGDTKAATWVRDTLGESKLDVNISSEKPFALIDFSKKEEKDA